MMTDQKSCYHVDVEIVLQTFGVTYYKCMICGKFIIDPPIRDWRNKGDKWMESD